VTVGNESDWRAAGDRIDALIAASASGGVVARERAEELVRLVVDLYGSGLERILELLHEQGQLTDGALDALAGDEFVASLLLVHGLHPYSVESRIDRALDGIRGSLAAQHADAELLEVGADGTARLRLIGSGEGCGSAALRQLVEEAVEAAAPDVTAIEIEAPAADEPVIPVASLFARVGRTP